VPKPCTFCAILSGQSPAFAVLDDDAVMAFLDTRPLFLGHVLLVPRVHVETLPELEPSRVPHFFRAAQRIDRAVTEVTGADGSMILINNVVSQSVPHLHLHVIPRRRGDGLRFWLGPRRRYDDDDHAARMAHSIREAIE